MSKIRETLKDRLIKEIPQYNKKSGAHKATLFIAKCPTINCKNEIRVYKNNSINSVCRKCAVSSLDRTTFKLQKWVFLTNDILKAKSKAAIKRPDLFIREEQVLAIDGAGAIRAILKCPTTTCNSHVSSKDGYIGKCMKCANLEKRLRPYERTFNRCRKQRSFTKSNNQKIEWLMTYEEFAGLCKVNECHYCNAPLNRAAYKAEKGTTAVLLDRKDSSKSYTIDNCVPCCAICNFTKNEHISYKEMVMISEMRGVWIDYKILPGLTET